MSSGWSRPARAAVVGLAALSLLAVGSPALAEPDEHGDRSPQGVWPSTVYPRPAAVRSAQRFAASRGDVSFAVVDRSIGLRGYDSDRQFSSASVSKALLLAAELQRLRREGLPLDGGTRALLEPMVTYSDNRAADAIYERVGDEGLEEVAERAGMRSFEPVPGYWGGDRITAADMARFFYRLEANLPGPHRPYAMALLSRITPVESWGIPQAVGHGWSLWFKGGWRPPGEKENSGPVTHQAALLEHRRGERVALAVLTNQPPGGSSFATIEGIAARLLSSPPPCRGGWTAP
ncbi:MAG TPA: serine hydrolase [Solirubrobacterales bacterium]|nr:serine hydrolase [Solirubrobacterales bacterium]